MADYVPDPIERMEAAWDRLASELVDEHTCMGCGKHVDYTLLVADPMGMGPAVCVECLGFDPFEKMEQEPPHEPPRR